MTALIVVAAVIVLITALLFLPISAILSFDGDFSVKIKLLGIKLFNSETEPTKEPKGKTVKDTEKKENTFSKLKGKYGFSGAVKEILSFVRAVLERLKKQLKKIMIRRLRVEIRVASTDAAQTAVEYGAVCAAFYPWLSFFDNIANVKMKQINVTADFDSGRPQFSFSAIVKLRIINLLIMAFGVFSEYTKFKTRNEL